MSLNCQVSARGGETEIQKRYEFQRVRMGVPWNLQFYADSDAQAVRAADEVYARIKQLDRCLSDYDPDSELNQFTKNAVPGQPVSVSADLFAVLKASVEVSAASEGAFDVTVGPITELWRKAWRKQAMPAAELLKAQLQKVGYQKIRLHPADQTVELLSAGMELDLGGIAKGYAADEALQTLRSLGIGQALIDASGDIVVGDPPPGKEFWIISIEPLRKNAIAEKSTSVEYLQLRNASVATSGDANRYVEIDGVRYSHLVDPQSGLGLTTPSSVTIIAADGMTADALASAVSVLGPVKGLAFLKKYAAQGLIVLGTDDGQKSFESCGYQKYRIDPK